MISSTEAMLAAKEQLAKKGARELRGTGTQPLFTDDGFALGLAYLLEVLGQNGAFDSLGWLQSAQVNLLFYLGVVLWFRWCCRILCCGANTGKGRASFPKIGRLGKESLVTCYYCKSFFFIFQVYEF
jgi:hypothetical protein